MELNGGGKYCKIHSESDWDNVTVQSWTCIVVFYDTVYFQLIT